MNDTDRVLAERLMGWIVKPLKTYGGELVDWYIEPFKRPDLSEGYIKVMSVADWHPTQNITQALGDGGPGTVVGQLFLRGYDFELRKVAPENIFQCCIFVDTDLDGETYSGQANTPVAAICEAARAAMEGEKAR